MLDGEIELGWLQFYWDAYQVLSLSRPIIPMAGPAPIQVSEVLAFCSLHGIRHPEERALLLRLVQTIDLDHLQSTYRGRDGERRTRPRSQDRDGASPGS